MSYQSLKPKDSHLDRHQNYFFLMSCLLLCSGGIGMLLYFHFTERSKPSETAQTSLKSQATPTDPINDDAMLSTFDVDPSAIHREQQTDHLPQPLAKRSVSESATQTNRLTVDAKALETPKAIEDFLQKLDINAISSKRVVINNRVYLHGEALDLTERIHIQLDGSGGLLFKVDGTLYQIRKDD